MGVFTRSSDKLDNTTGLVDSLLSHLGAHSGLQNEGNLREATLAEDLIETLQRKTIIFI